jgi:iron complex transport system substrate-binding protein
MARFSIISDRLGRRASLGVALALGLAACVAEPSAPREQEALTIVSLNPCLDAILVEVAGADQVLALSHYSRDPASSSLDPAAAKRFGVTGGTVEEVLVLEPDIVLASTFIAPTTRSALERMGVRVETFGSPVSVEESLAQVREIAALAKRKGAGEALVKRIESALAVPAGRREIDTLLWQPGQIVPGEVTLIGELLRRGGFASHSTARGLGQGDHVALETLLADPPELLLVAGSSAGQSHPMLRRMRSTQVEPLAPNLLYCGGPTIIAVQRRLDAIRARAESGQEGA